jgi:VanZ family protein
LSLSEWRGSRTARTIFWATVAFSFVMAILPQPPEIPGEPNDKLQHMAAFATLALFGAFAYPRLSLLRLLAGLSMFGAFIELVQAIPALHRDSELLDWVADTLAVVVVLLLVFLWRCLRSGPAAR